MSHFVMNQNLNNTITTCQFCGLKSLNSFNCNCLVNLQNQQLFQNFQNGYNDKNEQFQFPNDHLNLKYANHLAQNVNNPRSLNQIPINHQIMQYQVDGAGNQTLAQNQNNVQQYINTTSSNSNFNVPASNLSSIPYIQTDLNSVYNNNANNANPNTNFNQPVTNLTQGTTSSEDIRDPNYNDLVPYNNQAFNHSMPQLPFNEPSKISQLSNHSTNTVHIPFSNVNDSTSVSSKQFQDVENGLDHAEGTQLSTSLDNSNNYGIRSNASDTDVFSHTPSQQLNYKSNHISTLNSNMNQKSTKVEQSNQQINDYDPLQSTLEQKSANIISVQPESQLSKNHHSVLLNQKDYHELYYTHANFPLHHYPTSAPHSHPVSTITPISNYNSLQPSTTPTNKMLINSGETNNSYLHEMNSDFDYRSRNTTPYNYTSNISPNMFPHSQQLYSPMIEKIQTPSRLYNESIVSRDHTPLSTMTSPLSISNRSSPLVNLNGGLTQSAIEVSSSLLMSGGDMKLQPKASIKRKRIHKGANCPICGKFISRDLSRHLRIHEPVGRFQCIFSKEKCKHKTGYFNRPYDFKKHLLHFHFKFEDPKVKALNNLSDKLDVWGECHCGKKFKSSTWLDDHILTDDDNLRCHLVVRKDDPFTDLAMDTQKFQ